MRLYCAKHHQYTDVSSAFDFYKVSEGGCGQMCGDLMACGHSCKSLCHTLDREHENMHCFEPCERLVMLHYWDDRIARPDITNLVFFILYRSCPSMHPCKLFCYQLYARCKIVVEKSLYLVAILKNYVVMSTNLRTNATKFWKMCCHCVIVRWCANAGRP